MLSLTTTRTKPSHRLTYEVSTVDANVLNEFDLGLHRTSA